MARLLKPCLFKSRLWDNLIHGELYSTGVNIPTFVANWALYPDFWYPIRPRLQVRNYTIINTVINHDCDLFARRSCRRSMLTRGNANSRSKSFSGIKALVIVPDGSRETITWRSQGKTCGKPQRPTVPLTSRRINIICSLSVESWLLLFQVKFPSPLVPRACTLVRTVNT